MTESRVRRQGGDNEQLRKTLVTSLDFGLTDPDALAFWRALPGCRVLVAGSSGLDRGNLVPAAAFHPKIYLFDRPDGTSGSLVGSANLTNRGLTVNGEVAWSQRRNLGRHNLDQTWRAAITPAVPLTERMLEHYRALRGRVVRAESVAEELAPVPAPRIDEPRRYAPFAEAEIEPADYDRMWIQSRGMQGGAGTQLELPRGTHDFSAPPMRTTNSKGSSISRSRCSFPAGGYGTTGRSPGTATTPWSGSTCLHRRWADSGTRTP